MEVCTRRCFYLGLCSDIFSLFSIFFSLEHGTVCCSRNYDESSSSDYSFSVRATDCRILFQTKGIWFGIFTLRDVNCWFLPHLECSGWKTSIFAHAVTAMNELKEMCTYEQNPKDVILR